MLSFTVYGIPQPQGSTKAFIPKGWRRAVITSDNRRLRPWRQCVVDEALKHTNGRASERDLAFAVSVEFYMLRPKSAPKRVACPTKIPDVDKLLRAILDALTTAGAWRDDSQVVDVRGRKRYAGGIADPVGTGGLPRAVIDVIEVREA